jgi:hypothetical protein
LAIISRRIVAPASFLRYREGHPSNLFKLAENVVDLILYQGVVARFGKLVQAHI